MGLWRDYDVIMIGLGCDSDGIMMGLWLDIYNVTQDIWKIRYTIPQIGIDPESSQVFDRISSSTPLLIWQGLC